MSQLITTKDLRQLKISVKKAAVAVESDYAKGFIKACRVKQVNPQQLIEIAETLDINL